MSSSSSSSSSFFFLGMNNWSSLSVSSWSSSSSLYSDGTDSSPEGDYYSFSAEEVEAMQQGYFYCSELDFNTKWDLMKKTPEGQFIVEKSNIGARCCPFHLVISRDYSYREIAIVYNDGFLRLRDSDMYAYMSCARAYCHEEVTREYHEEFYCLRANSIEWKIPRFRTLLELLDHHMTECQRGEEPARTILKMTTPRRYSVPTLTHLARLSINRRLRYLQQATANTTGTTSGTLPTSQLCVPQLLKDYLDSYPYGV